MIVGGIGVICVIGFLAPTLIKKQHIEHVLFPSLLSFELRDAPSGETPEKRVKQWLYNHRMVIVFAERRFRVDRRAIAGLIAYEALENVHVSRVYGVALWSGPGKVHFKEFRFSEGRPLAKEVEELRLLPRQTVDSRERLLQDPGWAALYIGASMRALADVVLRDTKRDVSCEPGALVTLAAAWSLNDAMLYFKTPYQRRVHRFNYNLAGSWVASRLALINDAVGTPSNIICQNTVPVTRDR